MGNILSFPWNTYYEDNIHCLGNYEDFCATHDIKVPTGGVCIFDCVGDHWRCTDWGIKAYKLFK